MTSYINPVLHFILEALHGDSEIVNLVDNRFYTGLLRDPVSLTAPHYTRVGIEYSSDSGDGYFFSRLRDWDENKIQIKITVVTSYGHNEDYCRQIIDAINDLFWVNRIKTTEEYKIYIDKISSSIVENEQARWIGTINLEISYVVPIPSEQ